MAESVWIDKYFRPLVQSEGAAGLTDDVASLSYDQTRIVTTDTIIENVHFLPDDPMDSVGHKIVTVNVSDILSKGAYPTEAVLNLTWSRNRKEIELEEFATGLGRMLRNCDVRLIGGDTTTHSGNIVVSMTLHGQCLSNHPIRRSTGNVFDLVWVTGKIGGSGLGLQSLKGNRIYNEFVQTYRYPAPPDRIIARAISDFATASMDVSDGLLLDVNRLSRASGLGAKINLETVPLAFESEREELILEQCTSGDDYQILFTTPETRKSQIIECAQKDDWEVSCIGVLQPNLGLRICLGDHEIKLPERLGYIHQSTI